MFKISSVIKKNLAKYGIWIIFSIFILTTFSFFCDKTFDNQEIDYLRISQRSVEKIIFDNYGDQMPFWFLLVKFYTGVFGKSEISLKILSISIFLLSAFVLYKICEIYGLNKHLTTSLFLFNPLLLREIAFTFKHWSFLVLTALSALYFFEKFKSTKSKKYLFLLFSIIIAGIYSNLIFLIFLCAFTIYILANLISKQISFKIFALFLIICAFSTLPFLYYYEKAAHQLIDVQGNHMDWGTSTRGLDFIKESLGAIAGVKYLDKHNLLYNGFIWLILLLIIIQIIPFKKIRENIKLSYAKLWLASTIFFILIFLMFWTSRTPVESRYFAVTVPFFCLAIFPKSKRLYALITVILLFSLTIFSSWQMAKGYHFDNWKGVTSFLQPKIKENTQILILYKFNVGDLLMEYYLKKPVTRLYSLESASILYSDDIWVVRRHGKYDAIYKIADEYNIEEYKEFEPIILFHLTKKSPEKNKSLIFNNPLIEIEKGRKTQKLEFLNGAISAWNCKKDWQRIRIDKITSGNKEKVCLFTHPRNNTKINLIYKDIKLSKSIKFSSGISDSMVIGDKSPVYMDVYIDNVFIKRIINPDTKGWLTTKIDTNQYENKSADLKLVVYTDYDEKRHFCFDAEVVDENAPNDYFYNNIKKAIAKVEDQPYSIYQTASIWPHNETKPPFLDSKIFERWDCEENLITKSKIWNTIGKSFAISGNEFKEAIWFHPIANKMKSLEYNNINLYVDKIIGYYGINDYALPKTLNPILTFTITANGEKIYEEKFKPTAGWKDFDVPFNKVLNSIVFSITTTNDRWNHFFFNAFLENK
ncbi:glycosyltransferase family 39 protein [Patescibacteria group bacterium]|nr:glycosyltransferase family 39 protein [Patescibacteria group bacterium]